MKTLIKTAEEFEQFIALPENRERLLELIHGEIVEKEATEERGVIAAKIGSPVLMFADQHNLGYAGVQIRHHKPSDRYNVRMPDVSFRRADSPVVKRGAVPRMPDLAVEIQSPGDQPHHLREKAIYYLRNGSQLVWLVYTSMKIVEVCVLDDNDELSVTQLGIEDTLDGGNVLPGFGLPITQIFPE